MRFTLRQALYTVPAVALGLLLVRWSIRSHALAVGLASVVLAVALLLLVSLVLYGFLRGVGGLWGLKVMAFRTPHRANLPGGISHDRAQAYSGSD
jgi:hypothetical protein